MNHAYIPYDLVINEPRFAPGTVVRIVKDKAPQVRGSYEGVVGIWRSSERVEIIHWSINRGVDWVIPSECVFEFEPLSPDDPANIYPGDKVVCVESDTKNGYPSNGKIGVINENGYVSLENKGPWSYKGSPIYRWAILEPATTPIDEIEEGDEVVCRTGAWQGAKRTVFASNWSDRYYVHHKGREFWIEDFEWLVTKKAAKKDALTEAELAALSEAIGHTTIEQKLVGAIIDDCIKRGWMMDYSLGPVDSIYFVRRLQGDSTHLYPYTLTGIARAYLEAREKWG